MIAKNLPSTVVIVIFLIVFGWLTYSYNKEKETVIQSYQNNFIHDEFYKKKNEVERTFTLIYQSLRTISLVPSVRKISGKNRQNEKEDVVESNRFSADGALTVQQLYNNLVANVSVSEIYAVLNHFDHSKGEIPFFMFDKVLISPNDKTEEKKETKTPDTPEESEDEEYRYFPTMLQNLKQSSPVFDPQKGLDSIPAHSSQLMRTCDNDQYKSIKDGDINDSKGIIYAVPFYNLNNRLSGAITAVIRKNVLEALLLGVPKLVITPEDKKEFEEKKWLIPQEPSRFFLMNAKTGVFLSDRRLALNDTQKNSITSTVLAGMNTDMLFSQKISVQDNQDWFLAFDFSATPWMQEVSQTRNQYLLKVFGAALLSLLVLIFLKVQTVRIRGAVNFISTQLARINAELQSASQASKTNGEELSLSVDSMAATVREIAASVVEIESQALVSTQSAQAAQNISTQLANETDLAMQHIENLLTEMRDISQSNEKVAQIAHAIREIQLKTKNIEDVVFKTQLLAFNASIEAARAGEHGKGFGVVAQELGTLAQVIQIQAQEIAQIVKKNEKESQIIAVENEKCVKRGEQTTAELRHLIGTVSQEAGAVKNDMTMIAEAMTQQLAGLKQIAVAMNDIQSVTHKNTSLAQIARELADKLEEQTHQQAHTMAHISQTFGSEHSTKKETSAETSAVA